MQIFKGNDKISIYGNLNINNHKNKIKEKVYISVENQKLERIAKVILEGKKLNEKKQNKKVEDTKQEQKEENKEEASKKEEKADESKEEAKAKD